MTSADFSTSEKTLCQDFHHLLGANEPGSATIDGKHLGRIIIRRPLRGLGVNYTLRLKGPQANSTQLDWAIKKANSNRTLLFVLALDSPAYSAAMSFRAREPDRVVVLNHRQLQCVVESASPVDEFLALIRQQVSYLALVPFEVSSPAFGPFFFGRASELKRLQSHQDFAISGAGGMGKSSLLRHWIWLRRLNDREAFDRTVEVDLMGVPEPDEAARLIIAAIQRKSSVRIVDSDVVTVRNFSEVSVALHRDYAKISSSAPFHLVLDEVGSLIEVDRHRTLGDYFQRATSSGLDKSPFPFLQTVRKLVSDGVFRLALCSRTETRELLQHPMNPFCVDGNYSRLRPLEIGRLHDHEAEKMLTEPLRALGVDVAMYRGRIDDALRKAVGIPFQLADYGLDIALDAEPANVQGSIQRNK
jgi:hypothetical protein